MKTGLFIAILAGFLAFTAIAAGASEYTELRGATRIVKVVLEDGANTYQGSAVVINPTTAVTAAHVADGIPNATSAWVGGPTKGSRVIDLSVEAIDKHNDVAVLKGSFFCPCAAVGRALTEDDVDARIVTIGFPKHNLFGLQILDEGMVQGQTSDGILSTGFGLPGGSGGGLFAKQDGKWRLVGIVRAMWTIDIPVHRFGGGSAEQELTRMVVSAPINFATDLLKCKYIRIARECLSRRGQITSRLTRRRSIRFTTQHRCRSSTSTLRSCRMFIMAWAQPSAAL